MSYLTADRRYTIRLNQPFSVPMVRADNTVTERWEAAFNDSDDWVEIQDELSDYDRRLIESQGSQIAYHAQGLPSNLQVSGTTREAMYLGLFKTVIKDWSLKEGADVLPLNENTFRKLGAVGGWIYDAIEAHYLHQQITPAQAKNFVRVPAPSISAPAPSPEHSPTSTSPNGSAHRLIPVESSSYPVESSSSP